MGDTWTKSRWRVEVGEGGGFGWGGVERWGKSADNCNWITIKIKEKENERTHSDSIGLVCNFQGPILNMNNILSIYTQKFKYIILV